jgi:hypothetical protein
MNTDERYARLQRSENARERNVAYEQIQRLNPRPQVTMFLPQTPTSKTLPELVSETVGPCTSGQTAMQRHHAPGTVANPGAA